MAGIITDIVESFQRRRDSGSASLEITMPRLPSPPYGDSTLPAEPMDLSGLPVETVDVKVGEAYDFITGSNGNTIISPVRVEKMWNHDGQLYVLVSQRWATGRSIERRTHAMHITEFKQRVVAGGIKKVVI